MHVRFFWLFRKKSTNQLIFVKKSTNQLIFVKKSTNQLIFVKKSTNQLIFVKKGKPTFVEPLKIYSLNYKYPKTQRGSLSFLPPLISLLFLNIYF